VKQDGYVVDEHGHKLTLKDFGLEVKFAGRLMWFGKGGRLEVYRDETKNAWYASIPVEVGVETKKRVTSQKSSTVKKSSIQVESPKREEGSFNRLGNYCSGQRPRRLRHLAALQRRKDRGGLLLP